MAVLRAEADVIDADGKGKCAFCKFHAARGMVSFRGNGHKIIACYPCFAAEHALADHGHRGRLIYAPETDQPQISHLGRTLAWLKAVTGIKNRNDAIETGRSLYRQNHTRNPNKAMASAFSLYEELLERADKLDREFSNNLDMAPRRGILSLPGAAQSHLAKGLRFLPTAFLSDEVHSWTHEPSGFDGMGAALLSPVHDWFVATIER